MVFSLLANAGAALDNLRPGSGACVFDNRLRLGIVAVVGKVSGFPALLMRVRQDRLKWLAVILLGMGCGAFLTWQLRSGGGPTKAGTTGEVTVSAASASPRPADGPASRGTAEVLQWEKTFFAAATAGGREAVARIREALRHSDAAVRRVAVSAACLLAAEAANPLLVMALQDSDAEVRELALQQVDLQLEEEQIQLARLVFQGGDREAARRFLRRLQATPDRDRVEPLLEAAGAGSPAMQAVVMTEIATWMRLAPRLVPASLTEFQRFWEVEQAHYTPALERVED